MLKFGIYAKGIDNRTMEVKLDDIVNQAGSSVRQSYLDA